MSKKYRPVTADCNTSGTVPIRVVRVLRLYVTIHVVSMPPLQQNTISLMSANTAALSCDKLGVAEEKYVPTDMVYVTSKIKVPAVAYVCVVPSITSDT